MASVLQTRVPEQGGSLTGAAPVSPRTALRSALLSRTLANAAAIPFYQRHWLGVDASAIRALEDLPRLPLVDRRVYREQYADDLPDGEPPFLLTHTSGTSGGLVFRHRSEAEVRFTVAFFERIGAERRLPIAPRPIILVAAQQHGMGYPAPSRGYPLRMSIRDPAGLAQALKLLRHEFTIAGVAPRVGAVFTSAG